jgi:hypothetical protein
VWWSSDFLRAIRPVALNVRPGGQHPYASAEQTDWRIRTVTGPGPPSSIHSVRSDAEGTFCLSRRQSELPWRAGVRRRPALPTSSTRAQHARDGR